MKKINFFSIIVLLIVLSLLIIIHELGHFLACKLFDIPTHVFSVGFGPALIRTTFWQTTFQIALLPLGGYVSMDVPSLQAAAYWQKMIIILSGVGNNFLIAFFIIIYLSQTVSKGLYNFSHLIKDSIYMIIGKKPVKDSQLVSFMQRNTQLKTRAFLFFIVVLNIELGLFNLLPIPMLDGGQALRYTIFSLADVINIPAQPILHLIYLLLFIGLIFYTFKSQKKLSENN